MSACINYKLGERTDRVVLVILDGSNIDVFRKVFSVYFDHHIYNEVYITDLDGICKKSSIYFMNISAKMWKVVFKILNLAGYYVVHDVNRPDLWLIGTYEELVFGKKYKKYIELVDEIIEGDVVVDKE